MLTGIEVIQRRNKLTVRQISRSTENYDAAVFRYYHHLSFRNEVLP
ncbi:Uncharacterised protein [Vibrio cholerae]|nr:Uncharacterised protein [Vibrio cholerae]